MRSSSISWLLLFAWHSIHIECSKRHDYRISYTWIKLYYVYITILSALLFLDTWAFFQILAIINNMTVTEIVDMEGRHVTCLWLTQGLIPGTTKSDWPLNIKLGVISELIYKNQTQNSTLMNRVLHIWFRTSAFALIK